MFAQSFDDPLNRLFGIRRDARYNRRVAVYGK